MKTLGYLAAAAVAFALLASVNPAWAQADALNLVQRHCLDRTLSFATRLASCNLAASAQGLAPLDQAVAYVNIGSLYEEQHDSDSALAAYSKALSIQPTIWEALANRAFLYLSKGDVDLALADYKAVVATDPNDAVLGTPDEGDYRPIPESGKSPNTNSPERDLGIRSRAILKLRDAVATALSERCRQGLYNPQITDKAMADCGTALDIAPGFPPALVARGFLEFLHKDYAATVKDLKGVPPNLASAIYIRGAAEHRLNDETDGDADIAAAEKLKPGITAAMIAHGAAP